MKHFFLKSTLALLLFVLGVGQASAQNANNWIQTDGTNYINTGYYPTSNTMARIKFYKHSSTVGKDAGNLLGIFGSEKTAANPNGTGLLLGVDGAGHPYIKMGTAYYYITNDNCMDPGWLYYATLKNGEFKTSHSGYDGTARTRITWSPCPYFSMNVNPIYIASISGTSRKSFITIYDFIIYENNTEVRHFYPAKWNGVYGLYEAKQNKFYSKAAGNNFSGIIYTCPHTYNETEKDDNYQTHKHCHICDGKHSYVYKKVITFNANGGTGSMSQQTIDNSGSIKGNTFTREGFKFAGWSTTSTGSVAYKDNASITVNSSNKGTMTLYAQWEALPITAKFDYTYRTSDIEGGEETYVHMDGDHESAAITDKVRANLRDASGTILVSKVLTAPAATTPSVTPTYNISTHKTAAITLNVVQSGTENLSGTTCTVVLGNKYTNYRSIDFEVLTNTSTTGSETLAPHWVSTKQSATSYLFKYEGHESRNMFDLTWTVNLKNLSMYPEDIFVKPMRKGTHSDNGGNTNLEQIPAMQNTKGIECKFASNIYEGGKIVGAYYTGEYRVLKTCAHNKPYNYEIGLTGFILNGITYYLAENEGDIPSDMISSAVASQSNTSITFDRLNTDIPVLLLDPNVDANFQLPEEKRATINGQIYQLYVDNHATRTVNLEQFEAVRPGYTFTGWKDTYDNTEYAYNGDYHFNMGTKATTTLLAQWERTNAPVIDMTEMKEEGQNFVYTVNISDELNDLRDVKYIYASGYDAPAVDAQDWIALTLTEGVGRIELPMLNDKFGKNLWVKASNEHKTTVLNLGTVRSIYTVQANPNPDSHVVEQIDNGTWSEPAEGEEPVFTPDPENPTISIDYYDYYSTFYFAERAFLVSNATAYMAQRAGTNLDLTEIEPDAEGKVIVPAGVAVILRKNYATDGKIECEEVTDIYSGNTNNILEGVDDPTSPDEANYTYYVLSYAQNGLGFYINVTGRELAAHKAYFTLDGAYTAAAPRAFIFNFGNGNDPVATAIENTEAETLLNGPVYNIYGQMVAPSLDKAENLASGIYVVNGKKVVINK